MSDMDFLINNTVLWHFTRTCKGTKMLCYGTIALFWQNNKKSHSCFVISLYDRVKLDTPPKGKTPLVIQGMECQYTQREKKCILKRIEQMKYYSTSAWIYVGDMIE